MAFECTAFRLESTDRLTWECSPEELHRRRQAKYDELWGSSMGDQLAKGWADPKARALEFTTVWQEEWAKKRALEGPAITRGLAFGAPSLYPTETEVQAEEDMLP